MIYVDDLQVWPHARGRFKAWSCHMTADTVVELHAFAARIGVKRHWYHATSLAPHYDLIETERQRALDAGAQYIPAQKQARRRMAARKASR